MKTRHTAIQDFNFLTNVWEALREVKSYVNNLRVVNCGRGIVILPDTNRKQDCTEGEIIKALGLSKKYNCLDFEQNKPRFNYVIEHSDGSIHHVALTEDQIRLLDWLYKKGVFWEELTYRPANPNSFEEV